MQVCQRLRDRLAFTIPFRRFLCFGLSSALMLASSSSITSLPTPLAATTGSLRNSGPSLWMTRLIASFLRSISERYTRFVMKRKPVFGLIFGQTDARRQNRPIKTRRTLLGSARGLSSREGVTALHSGLPDARTRSGCADLKKLGTMNALGWQPLILQGVWIWVIDRLAGIL